MHVYNAKHLNTFTSTKNSIIKPSHSSYDTPIKRLIQKAYTNESQSVKPTPQTATQQKQPTQQPINALKKNCFRKSRQIKSIWQLQPIYQTQIVCKSSYKYTANPTKTTTNSSSTSLHRKKSIIDKIPINIFALQSTVLQKPPKHQDDTHKHPRYYSQSKLIKNSIIRYN